MRSCAVSGGQLRRPTESAQILWILPTQFCRRLARGPLELRDLLPASSNFLADQNALIRSRPLLIAACSASGAEMRRFSRVSLIATSRLSNSAMKPVNAIVRSLTPNSARQPISTGEPHHGLLDVGGRDACAFRIEEFLRNSASHLVARRASLIAWSVAALIDLSATVSARSGRAPASWPS